MKLKKIILFALFFLLLDAGLAFSQSAGDSLTRPRLGRPMPDFTLNQVTHYKTKKISLADLHGKWTILDFWSLGCVACIQGLPGNSNHYQEFKSELNWIMVGLNDTRNNKGIREFYERARAKQGLDLPAAYDSILCGKWGIEAFPYMFILDPDGIVRHITTGHDLTKQKLRDLLDGKDVQLYDLTKVKERQPGIEKDILTGTVLYSSSLSRATDESPSFGYEMDQWVRSPDKYRRKGYTFTSVSLKWLYCLAFFGKGFWDYDDPLYGKIYPRVILEVKDSSLFQSGVHFNYSLALPLSLITKENLASAMQQDLFRGFGYEAAVEKRPVRVWKLVAKPGAIEKLKTKGGPEKYYTPEIPTLGFTARNWAPPMLLPWVVGYLQWQFDTPYIPFIDKTGIATNFDLALDADMMNLMDVQRALRKQGLDLLQGSEVMDALVIRDKKLP